MRAYRRTFSLMARPSAWKARACRASALRNIVPTSRSNRSMAWSQIGDQVERNSDQGRMTALTFVAGDMLYRGTAGLAGELGKAALMQVMSAGGIDADRANMVQTLDQPQHRGRLCRFRYLAQPDEPALTAFRAALGQSIEPAPLLGQQPAGQPAFNLSSRLMTQVDAEAFEGSK